jgi:long-subunit acyl-CoA synthetase (AMP-forming)
LSLLLENLAGVQAMLLRGASVGLPSLAEVGMQGASWIDPEPLRRALEHYRPTILILVPQLLQALIWLVERGLRLPQLRFAAVGGALVSPRLLWRAVELGLPVYEGYGLSECASVVALNTPGDARVGSVGRLLPHLSLAFAQDGELQIAGNGFLGYLGQCPRRPEDAVSTGDIGRLDADGFLHLRGRKGHVFVTSFGRNVSPEWVERELMAEPEIAQVVVFGEAKPWGTALVSVDGRGADAVTAALERVNRRLPDYARVRAWVRSDEPFSFSNQELTANGRPRRAVIWARYGERIEQLYS